MTYENLIRDVAKAVKKERILESLGLQSRASTSSRALGTLGWLGIGVVAGAALGLLLAPTTGDELRREVARRLGLSDDDQLEGELDEETLDELIT